MELFIHQNNSDFQYFFNNLTVQIKRLTFHK